MFDEPDGSDAVAVPGAKYAFISSGAKVPTDKLFCTACWRLAAKGVALTSLNWKPRKVDGGLSVEAGYACPRCNMRFALERRVTQWVLKDKPPKDPASLVAKYRDRKLERLRASLDASDLLDTAS